MTFETIRRYCLAQKGTTEELPFDDITYVYKVMGKIFALAGRDNTYVNLKCDPDYAVELRAQYEEVTPAYHMNKKHWISVDYTGSVSEGDIWNWIDNSYNLVVKGLPKTKREELAQL